MSLEGPCGRIDRRVVWLQAVRQAVGDEAQLKLHGVPRCSTQTSCRNFLDLCFEALPCRCILGGGGSVIQWLGNSALQV